MSSALLQRSPGDSPAVTRRARMRIGLGGGHQAQRDAVKEAFTRIREFELEIMDCGNELDGVPPDPEIAVLAILLEDAEQERWGAALQLQRSAGPPTLVVALLAERSSGSIEAALRAGADDVLGVPPAPEDTLRVLLRAAELRRRAEDPDDNKICSLVSISGGRGISSLTASLGFAAQRLLHKQTALIDLDLQAAPLSVLLDLAPEHSIADLADPTSPIDSIRLESVLSKYDSGPSLLAAPPRIEQAELVSTATVETALKVLHDLFDVIVVDCGNHLNESSVVVFENSDYLLYVVDQSVAAIRAARRFLDLYESLGLEGCQPSLILNRYRSDDVLTPEEIEKALQLPIFATVPYDEAGFKEMQITGRDLWSISSGASARRSIEKLARKLFALDSSDSSRPGLFGRLFGSKR